MADIQLKNPTTGDIYDVDEAEADAAMRANNLVRVDDPNEIKAWDQKLEDVDQTGKAGFLGSFETAAELSGASALTLGAKAAAYAGGASEQDVKDYLHPEKLFPGTFTPKREAIARGFREEHPYVSGFAEATPQILTGLAAGALTGGTAAVPTLAATFGTMAAESIPTGFSQEQLDSVLQKRDFSVQSAAQNSLVDMALGTLTFGVGKGLGYAARKTLPTNWLGRIEGKAAGGALKNAEREAAESGAAGAAAAERAGVKEVAEGTEGAFGDAAERATAAGETVPPAAGGKRPLQSVGAAARTAESLDSEANRIAKVLPEIQKGEMDKGVRYIANNIDDLRNLEASNAAKYLDLATEDGLAEMRKAKHANFEIGAKLWKKGNLAAQDKGLEEIVEQGGKGLIQSIATATTKDAAGVAGHDLKGLQRAIPDFINRHLRQLAETEGATRNIVLDEYKRGLDRFINNIPLNKIDQASQQMLIDKVMAHADAVREFLQSEKAWGKNGVLQEKINEPWHRLIEPLIGIQKKVQEITGREFGVAGAAGINREANVGALKQLMAGNAFLVDNDLKKFATALEGMDDLAAAYREHGVKVPHAAEVMRDAIAEVRNSMNKASVYNTAMARAAYLQKNPTLWDALGKTVDAGLKKIPVVGAGKDVLDIGLHVLKHLAGKGQSALKEGPLFEILDTTMQTAAENPQLLNPAVSSTLSPEVLTWIKQHAIKLGINIPVAVGAIGAGAALLGSSKTAGAAELPGKPEPSPEEQAQQQAFATKLQGMTPEQQKVQLRYAQAFSNINAATEAKVSAAVSTLFRNTTADEGQVAPKNPAYVAVQKRAQDLGVSPVVAKFTGNKETPLESFNEKKKSILAAMNDPSKLAESMGRNLGQLPQHEPEMFMQLVGTVQKTVEYLHQQLPPPVGKSLMSPDGIDPTDEQIADFAGHYQGAVHPLDTLEDVAHNTYTDEQLKAVKALWAPTYASFQNQALGTLQQLGQEGKTMPLDVLQHLDLALELNGAADPMTSWEMADFIHKSAAQSQQEKPGESPAGGSQGSSQPARPIDPQGKLSKRLTPNSFNLFQQPP